MRGTTSTTTKRLVRAARERERRRKMCPDCGVVFLPKGRKSSRCSGCYPAYRRCVNMLASARHRSSTTCDLSVEWLRKRLEEGCPKVGLPFELLKTGANYRDRHPLSPSLDQIIPGKGYTMRNIQVVCWWYNAAKQRFSDKEVVWLCQRVVRKQNPHS